MASSANRPYSGANPIPKVGDFLKETGQKVTPGKHSKDDLSGRDEKRAVKKGEGVAGGDERVVTDPTTGGETVIEDAHGNPQQAADETSVVVPRINIEGKEAEERRTGKPYPSPTQDEKTYAENQDVTAPPDPVEPHTTTDVPIHGEKTNVLFHPTPTLSLSDTVFASFEKRAITLCIGMFSGIVILGKMLGGGSILSLLLLATCASGGVWYWAREVMEEARTVDWESEKKRGETAVNNLIPESVEWMNRLIGLVWGMINPEMFSSIADQLEDVMQASVPGVIENVRVAEISQGTNPIRILSLRALPSRDVEDLKRAADHDRAGRDEQERLAEEQGGEVYNLEVSFAYNAAPVEKKGGISSKARNLHMQVVFYAGVKGLFGVPLPIWVDLKGLVGTARMRIHLSPDSPFMKTLTFTLMGIPQVSVACIPMIESGINVLNLPLISQFVNASIATAANEYVAPKSMTMEIGKMLLGDDVKKETEAVGVLWVHIDRAEGLSAEDRNGGSDPYITLSFSKVGKTPFTEQAPDSVIDALLQYGKPMYSTRVIVNDLNPVWNERASILVKADHIKAQENLSVELWDSDRFTADDCVGKCEISLHDLMLEPGKMHKQVSTLSGDEADSKMPGKLHWSVGFFGKPKLRPALRTSGKDINLPAELQDHPELQDAKGSLDTAEEDAIMHTPPDPLFPSGILSVIVHQIVNLEVKEQTGTYEKRKNGKEYSPGMETGENNQEEGGKLPSSYCTITLNDQLAYRTRTKVVSSKPIFNAGTERFIRDWRNTMLTVSVRDQRQREHDPLLGVVPIKVSDILQTSSEVTRWFPLDAGLGFGRIRLSILFRQVDLQLPLPLLGWDVGTFVFCSDKISSTLQASGGKLKFRTGGSVGKIGKRNFSGSNGTAEWNTAVGTRSPRPLRLPVRHRYMSPVVIDVFASISARKPTGHAIIWLDTIVDNEPTDVDIPIWSTNNPQRLTQNYIENPKYDPSLEVEELGRLRFRCTFKPGMDESHKRFATDNDARETFESWTACKGDGIRGDTVHRETNRIVQKLHEQSIRDMRNDIAKTDTANIDEDEEKRLTDKYGKSWRGIFEDAVKAGNLPTSNSAEGLELDKPLPDVPEEEEDIEDSSDDDTEVGDSDSSYDHVGNPSSTDSMPSDSAVGDGNEEGGKKKHRNPMEVIRDFRGDQKGLHRKHRGLMQWKPVRSMAFAKDETVFAARKMAAKVKLDGREPDVETEV